MGAGEDAEQVGCAGGDGNEEGHARRGDLAGEGEGERNGGGDPEGVGEKQQRERQGGGDAEVLRPSPEVDGEGAPGAGRNARQQERRRAETRVEEGEEAVGERSCGHDGEDVGENLLWEGDVLVAEEWEQPHDGREANEPGDREGQAGHRRKGRRALAGGSARQPRGAPPGARARRARKARQKRRFASGSSRAGARSGSRRPVVPLVQGNHAPSVASRKRVLTSA